MLEIQDILRASDVKRWHIVRTTTGQSLAEHLFNVTMIARAICKEYGIDDVKVMKACMSHDLDEILNGDVPTPAKQRHMELGYDLDSINGTGGRYSLSKEEAFIVKISDAIDAWQFISYNGSGRHAKQVSDVLGASLLSAIHDIDNVILHRAVENVVQRIEEGRFQI